MVSFLNIRRQAAGMARDTLFSNLGASYLIPPSLRWRYLKLLGLNVEDSMISAKCFIGGKKLSIGQRSFVNYGCFFDTSASIVIGADVNIGMGCYFITSTHEIGPSERRGGAAASQPITVGDGAWLGARVLILPGATIGRGSVVAAGSVVTRDVPDNSLVAGVPAKRIRQLSGSETPPSIG